MKDLPSGALPLAISDPYHLEYIDGDKYVPVPKENGHVVKHDDQSNGRWYTIQFDKAFIRGYGDGLKLAIRGTPLQVFPPTDRTPLWVARLRPGPFLDGIRLAGLHRHPEPETELYCFGFGAVWADWGDSPELAHRQYEHRLKQHIVETGRFY